MIHLELCEDSQLIEAIVNHIDIAPYVLEDNTSFMFSKNTIALLIKDYDKIMGCFILRPVFSLVLEVHTCMFKTFAHKKRAALELYNWVIDSDIETLTTMVPENYLNVRAFCRSVGMRDTGIIPNAFKKDGILQSCKTYAITREQIKEVICQQ